MSSPTFKEAYLGSLIADAACMPASLYLARKYHDDFDAAITANAMVGGDNCHRGAVVGALVGAAKAPAGKWIEGLKAAVA